MTNIGFATLALVAPSAGVGGGFGVDSRPVLASAGTRGGASLGGGLLAGASRAIAPLAVISASVIMTAGLVRWGKTQIASIVRIETINTQTSAAIASTGGSAQVTAKHVEDLAGSLENATATEAESIQQGANLLLTFKNIRNEAGEGNDIFDQTTKSMVDMARAMGTDAQSGAIQLGKALNDPVAGIAALTRVGVQFTDEQKSMIASLVESGDIMSAQKIILGELNSQFGGSAQAYAQSYAGKIDLLGHAWGTFGEAVFSSTTGMTGGIATALTHVLNNVLTPAVAAAQSVFMTLAAAKPGGPPPVGFAGFLVGLGAVAQPIGSAVFINVSSLFAVLAPALSLLIPAVADIWTQLQPLQAIFAQLRDTILGSMLANLAMYLDAFSLLGAALSPTLYALVGDALAAILPAAKVIAVLVLALVSNSLRIFAANLAMLAPIVADIASVLGDLLGTALAGLAPIVVHLAQTFGDVLVAISPLLDSLGALVGAVLQLISPLLQLVGAILGPLIQLFAAILTPILGLIAPLVQLLTPALQFIAWVLGIVADALGVAIQWIADLVSGSGTAGAELAAVWGNTMGMFGDFFSNTFGMFGDFISNTLGMFGDFFGNTAGMFGDFFSNTGGMVGDFVSNTVGMFGDFVSNTVGMFSDFFSNTVGMFVDFGSNIFQGLMDGVGAYALSLVDTMLGPIAGAVDGVREALGIHSPSTVFEEAGAEIAAASWRSPELSPEFDDGGIMGAVRRRQQGNGYTQSNRVRLTNEDPLAVAESFEMDFRRCSAGGLGLAHAT